MSWSGPAASAACDYIECQRSFWDHVADFFLWLAENLLQIIDYVVDLVRWIATWLAWIATVAAIFIFVIDVIALVVTGGAGSIAAILSAPVFAVLGSIAVVAGTVSLLLWLVNLGVEWLQRLIAEILSTSAFPTTSKEKNCRFCEYRPVCHGQGLEEIQEDLLELEEVDWEQIQEIALQGVNLP